MSETRLPIERGPRGVVMAYGRRVRLLGLVVLANAVLVGLVVLTSKAVQHASLDPWLTIANSVGLVLVLSSLIRFLSTLARSHEVLAKVYEALKLLLDRFDRVKRRA